MGCQFTSPSGTVISNQLNERPCPLSTQHEKEISKQEAQQTVAMAFWEQICLLPIVELALDNFSYGIAESTASRQVMSLQFEIKCTKK